MAGKKIVLGQDARAEMIKGVNAVANAVKVTLGPRGRNVAIDNGFGAPKITKDGVSVAKIITLKDPSQNIGAQLMKNAASAADNDAGDGTTTATVLTQAMIHRANKSIVAGANPMDLKRGIDIAVETIINGLKQRSKKVSSNEEIQQVGTISSNGDAKIGELLTKALDAVGPEGIITVEQGKTLEDELELTEGFKLDRGYVSPYFVTNQEKMVVELDSPYILLYDKKLSNLQQILPILENLIQTGKPLFIIADEIEGEALATLIYNKMRGIIKVAAIKAPGFGDRKKATMEDIAVLTGGQVITEETGIKIENVALDVLGRAKKVIINKDHTTIIDGDGNKNDISSRVQQLKTQISETTSDYDKEKLQERLAKLAGGVAVLKVGGVTEIEVKERKDRVEDALNATKAAVEQGIIAGGGIALFVSTSLLDNLKGENADQQNGVKIVRDALEAPLRQIVENAGLDGSGIVAQLLTTNKGNNFGYDAQKLKYVDMFEAGIIDPTKVVISALKNAASVASSIICTEALITDEQDNAAGGSARPGMGGMGDMDGMGGF